MPALVKGKLLLPYHVNHLAGINQVAGVFATRWRKRISTCTVLIGTTRDSRLLVPFLLILYSCAFRNKTTSVKWLQSSILHSNSKKKPF